MSDGSAERDRAIHVSRCAAVTGLKDDAFRYFEKAMTENEPQVVWLKADPRFKALRGDPRYDRLLKRLNLNWSSQGCETQKGRMRIRTLLAGPGGPTGLWRAASLLRGCIAATAGIE